MESEKPIDRTQTTQGESSPAKGKFLCDTCGDFFQKYRHLKRHKPICFKRSSRKRSRVELYEIKLDQVNMPTKTQDNDEQLLRMVINYGIDKEPDPLKKHMLWESLTKEYNTFLGLLGASAFQTNQLRRRRYEVEIRAEIEKSHTSLQKANRKISFLKIQLEHYQTQNNSK